MDRKRPNIIILNPDQMRADSMSHLGNPAAVTPNLDKLAAEGVSFSHAFCQNPVCSPSRCSFMSGWYPHVAGHRTMQHLMHEREPVLLKNLKDDGYRVWMNQRNDLLPAQVPGIMEKYCTTYFKPEETPTPVPSENWRGEADGDNYYSFFRGEVPNGRDMDDIWTDGAIDFIKKYDDDQPFCIFLPWMLPHPVYQISEPYLSRIDRSRLTKRIKPSKGYRGKPKIQKELSEFYRINNWSEARCDELRAVYLAMCNKVDAMTGLVVDALKQKEIYDNTAIFFFSDHGDYTGDYNLVEKAQNCFEDCLTNVPFIVKLPKEYQKRKGISQELVELIDFYATVEELTGFPPDHAHFGQSLLPYIEGNREELRKEVFCEGGFRTGERYCSETGGAQGLVKENLYYPRISLQLSEENYNGKGTMCRTDRYKYIKRLYEQDEFYDLEKDPHEVCNEIDNPEYKDSILSLKERMLTHYQDTCDVVPFERDARFDPDMGKNMRH